MFGGGREVGEMFWFIILVFLVGVWIVFLGGWIWIFVRFWSSLGKFRFFISIIF